MDVHGYSLEWSGHDQRMYSCSEDPSSCGYLVHPFLRRMLFNYLPGPHCRLRIVIPDRRQVNYGACQSRTNLTDLSEALAVQQFRIYADGFQCIFAFLVMALLLVMTVAVLVPMVSITGLTSDVNVQAFSEDLENQRLVDDE